MADTYNRQVGERLRAIRRQQGHSLQDVEAQSSHEFKASVLGAYERGERSLSLPRMQRLAAFYGVPVDQLLPYGDRSATQQPTNGIGGITIDLAKVDRAGDETSTIIERFLRAIQVMRQDFNGRVLTIRQSDLQLLTGLLEESDVTIDEALAAYGVNAGSP